jgi:hypothetical protein
MKKYFLLAASVLLMGAANPGGCVTTSGTQGDIANVCEALGANAKPNSPGAIRYNTSSNVHGRLAGRVLALDLASRNRLGISLHCPGF